MSVVIPYYEGRETIARAVASLARQTVPPAEVVVVDDGSKAMPFDVATVDRAIPVRKLTLPVNRGIPGARNAGIRAAEHPWVAFLDQDDEWAPDKLERQWRVLEESGLDPGVAVFGRLLMETAGDRPHLRPPLEAIRRIETGGRRAAGAFVRYGNAVPLVTLLLSRQVFERHGYLDESLRGGADDTELVLRLIGEGVSFRFDGHGEPRAWSVAHRHTGRNYSDHAPRWVGDQLAFIPRLADRYPAVGDLRGAFLARSRFTLGRHHEREGDLGTAAREYGRAIRHDPWWWRAWAARIRVGAPRPLRAMTGRAWVWLKERLRERPDPEA